MVFRRFVVRVMVNRFVSFNTLFIVSEYILKDWDNLSNSAVTATSNATVSVFATPFKALCCQL
jgi:hypothetical protein